ncbi:MAG: IS200/IS605 family transposase [Bacteroidota bacterium]|nr:IS200/IS605 family transposase [Bacteroidota bacterium]
MPNTYSQIYIHCVFAVKNRLNLIPKKHGEEIKKYISGIISGLNCKLIAIENVPNHFHILVSMSPSISVSDFMGKVKANSSRFINEKKFVAGKFEWQTGYGVFSVSKSGAEKVIKYIINQEEHHRTKSFGEEYLEFLKVYEVPYDERYIFEDVL